MRTHVGPSRSSARPGVAILIEDAPEPNAATEEFRRVAIETGLAWMEHMRPILVDGGWVVYGRAWNEERK